MMACCASSFSSLLADSDSNFFLVAKKKTKLHISTIIGPINNTTHTHNCYYNNGPKMYYLLIMENINFFTISEIVHTYTFNRLYYYFINNNLTIVEHISNYY